MTKDCRISTCKTGMAFIAGAFALILTASGAGAQSTTMSGMKLSNDQPIQIESDKLEIHDQEHTALFTGKVKVVQGTTTMQSGKMTVYYKDKAAKPAADGAQPAAQPEQSASLASGSADIDKIVVTDKVLLTSGTQTATADDGNFDMASQTFILTADEGNKVILSDGPNVFTGCKLTVHMQTGQAELESCGGRVQIQLDPKSKPNTPQQKQN
ncbi:LPS ABC transporter substrate-binding protein LptA [Rhizobium ruizarguesonis]|uniref:LPS ABC transporter substrate-binding protein LptA n=1 Tax=Rhizobium ruizarguesonis TaxID=2081791 RepID=A0AAE5C3K2_9HYPH|nr:LptA/OstA family protein [Rhizobium ruizarguesonis]TCA33590.1 LPS ABC transporter substrate-binding protein LptA [Rhizobium leguminosarum bv. viciae]MCB2402500.1 LPS ABC transporter substrate-binding protein LptA [Rhizobium ruizarguesonis]NEI26902.1 LPS ABC transporter substrate-binding protein LptA [Rhizobium ruizarguesonis]NEI51718.1 LPS ABC transporter substrate-binding protein LptA [Rhizobium ruizarguesonis]TAU46586.1 LPS ABC transporter substrate-binding protein LptA [Rhizobium ruizarg